MKEKKEIKTFIKRGTTIYFLHEGEYWAASGSQVCRHIFIFSSLESKKGILAYRITKEEYEERSLIVDTIPKGTWGPAFLNIKLEYMGEIGVILIAVIIYFIFGEEFMETKIDYELHIFLSYFFMILTFVIVMLVYKYKLNKRQEQLSKHSTVSKRFNFDLFLHLWTYMTGISMLLVFAPLIICFLEYRETGEIVMLLATPTLSLLIFMIVYYPVVQIAYYDILPWNPNKEFIKSNGIKKKIAPVGAFIVFTIIMYLIFMEQLNLYPFN